MCGLLFSLIWLYTLLFSSIRHRQQYVKNAKSWISSISQKELNSLLMSIAGREYSKLFQNITMASVKKKQKKPWPIKVHWSVASFSLALPYRHMEEKIGGSQSEVRASHTTVFSDYGHKRSQFPNAGLCLINCIECRLRLPYLIFKPGCIEGRPGRLMLVRGAHHLMWSHAQATAIV